MNVLTIILIAFGYAAVIATAPAIGITAALVHVGVMCLAASRRRHDPRAPHQ